jgi:opine dehydrogenase
VDLALHGLDVTIADLPEFADTIEPIASRGCLRVTGLLGDHVVRVAATTDLREAIAGAGAIVVAVPAFGHAAFARRIVELVHADQVVVLTPGSTGGALEWARIATASGRPCGHLVAETSSLPYACRKVDPTHVHISGAKRGLPIAAFPARETANVVRRLGAVFPRGTVAARNVLETSLNNINAVAHPVPTLLNAGWIEHSGGAFGFYAEALTPSVARAMDAVDEDRLAVVEALGLERVSASDWDRRLYGLTGATTYEINQASEVHREIRGPASLDTRYLTEDVSFGLVPIASIAAELGVETPAIRLFIDLAVLLLGERIRSSARTAASLGLAGLGAAGMNAFVLTGDLPRPRPGSDERAPSMPPAAIPRTRRLS